jgi:hypothetical protein
MILIFRLLFKTNNIGILKTLIKEKKKQKPFLNDKKSNNEDNANLLRIRPNLPPLYGTSSEQKWRIFVNILKTY